MDIQDLINELRLQPAQKKEHCIMVALPISYIQGLVNWIGQQSTNQETQRLERDLKHVLSSYSAYSQGK